MEKKGNKITFLQKVALILAHKSGLVVDMETKRISKPKVTETDQKIIGNLEAKLIETNGKLKDATEKQKPKEKTDSIDFDKIIKPENMLPKGSVKKLLGLNGMIGDSFQAWYRTYTDGKERIWFVIRFGRANKVMGGYSMQESLTDSTFDPHNPILRVQYTTSGKFIKKKYVNVDPVPDIMTNSSSAEAISLIQTISNLLSQNSEAKNFIQNELNSILGSMKKDYQSTINLSLSEIQKQQMEIYNLKNKVKEMYELKNQKEAEAESAKQELQKIKDEATATVNSLGDAKDAS
jgi:hypothetical protein